VQNLNYDANERRWCVGAKDGDILRADATIVATPAFRAGQLLGLVAKGAAEELKQISYASTATVSLAYRSRDFPRPLDSFGFVVPAVEKRRITACTFSSLKYPGRAPANHVLLRAFVGGSLQPELFEETDELMEKNIREELASLLGVKSPPLFSRINRHPRSMPQYHVGHRDRIERIEAALAKTPGLALAGSAYHGVGISDCVRSGEEAAEKTMNYLIEHSGSLD
jgi:oxygen-dependent protoporphyrinogen oxidase